MLIANRYEMLEEMGSGGMGTVYRGTDTQTGDIVAIKQLKPEMTSPELIERFQREGQALRELNHPNMVKFLNTVEENGNHYLILEFIEGGDLKALLKTGELTIEQVLKIAVDIADALTRAHKLNIIHRDLKPANILVAQDGTALLTDFGVARVVNRERITDTDAIIGTIDYLAPEVFSDGDKDNRVDIWAFGVMLFEMLTGDVPFKAEHILQKIMAITTQATPDLEALRPDAPIDLIDLIYRMLEKDPHARIASVRHVGASLEDIIQGRSLHTPPETRFETPLPEIFERPKHNLPAQTTAFVGREAELTELARLLDDPNIRLVSIVAAGGMGKTRLALEAALYQIDNFENGVFFAELAPLSDPNNITSAIADATGYQFQSDGREQKQQILDFLANKNMLLVLDNFEHLLEGATIVTEILNIAPNVQILATSRQRLNQSGETVFNLSGMDFPEWETPDDALEYAAVKLFMQSARRVLPQFELTTDNMDSIARICILVQGMPLGIVLAASWVAMLSLEEIADEIGQGIDFLESEMSDLPERHRSIRAVFDYSWDLMSEAERDVFMKLSVFRGGFTRQAAQEVAGANLRILMNLMNKSLIRREAETGRYDIHELLRQYGEGQLAGMGMKDKISDIHCQHYLDAVAKREDDLRGRNQVKALHDIGKDFENVRLACDQALWQENYKLIDSALEALVLFLGYNNTIAGIPLLEQIASNAKQSNHTRLWARLIARLIVLHVRMGILVSDDLRTLMKQAFHVFEKLDDVEQSYCSTALSLLHLQDRDYEQARRGLELNLAKYERYGDATMQSWLLICIAICYGQTISVEAYITYTQRSLDVAQESGNIADAVWAMINLASTMLFYSGERSKAVEYSKQAIQITQQLGLRIIREMAQVYLGLAAFFAGDFKKAFQVADNVLQTAQEFRLHSMMGYALASKALASFGLQQYKNGKLLGEGANLKHTNYLAQYLVHWSIGLNSIALHDYQSARLHLTQALRLTLGFHVHYVLYLLPGFAMLVSQQGEHQRAAEYLALAYEHPISYKEWQDTAILLSQFRRNIRVELGVERYEIAYERGKSLELKIVVQKLLEEFGEENE